MRAMSRILVVAGVLCGLAVPLSFGAVPVPFADGFEGALDPGWTSNATGQISFTTDHALGGGNESCTFSFDELTLPVTPSTYDNVWVQVYARAAGMSEAPPSGHASIAGCSALFYVWTNGNVFAMQGNGDDTGAWVDTTVNVPLTANKSGWVGFIAHLDYVGNQYDLYYKEGGNASGDSLTRIVEGYNFYSNSTAAAMASFQVSTELATSLDAVALRTAACDTGLAKFGDIETTTTMHDTNTWKYIALGEHGLTGAESSLAASASMAKLLMSSFEVNDILRTWYTNGWSSFRYETSGPGPAWAYISGGLGADEVLIPTGGVAFVSYLSVPSVNFDVYVEGYVPENAAPPDPPTGGLDLYGTGNAAVNGWTPFVWGGGSMDLEASGLDDGAVGTDGARAFIRDYNSRLYQYRYRVSSVWTRSGGAVPFQLEDGQAGWVSIPGVPDSVW